MSDEVTEESAPESSTYSQSRGLVALLRQLNCAVLMTSYQSGLIYHLGQNPRGGLHVQQTAISKPMGLSYEDGRLTVAAGRHILQCRNVLAPNERVNETFDACFIPRRMHLTGALDAHDVGTDAQGQTIFVNTRFNCLATTDEMHSFTPLWHPPFIDRIVDEDRCHLNGLAMRDGAAAFVTAISRSNTIDGWRDRLDGGGVVIEVETGRVICSGLSMPHSPRWHEGRLWLLNSGTGELGYVEGWEGPGEGRFVPVVFCPGFVRGLSFAGGYAFVGLSRPRYERFKGLPLDAMLEERDSEPWCGMQVIDLAKGTCVEWFRIDGTVAELYDVAVLPGISTPITVGPDSEDAARLITLASDDAVKGDSERRIS